jgi:hypothetical protein
MNTVIKMGNDEFILYIRKNYPDCKISNDQLGKQIWIWLRDKGASKILEDEVCFWETSGASVDANLLPKTATQFEFERRLLPELYSYLDTFKDS